MKIKKGQILNVSHNRKGNFVARAVESFDTEADEWYPLELVSESVEGLNTTWEKGDRIDGRRGLCTVSIYSKRADADSVSIEDFGKDHWSLFAYVETRIVDYKGELDTTHLRSRVSSTWLAEYGTRLKGYFKENGSKDKKRQILNHDDYDCLKDFENAGLIKALRCRYKLTPLGIEIASKLRQHKAKGGQFVQFSA